MENLTKALYLSLAVFVFIVAFSLTMYLMNKLHTTAYTLVYRLDKTNYYDSLVLDEVISTNNDTDVNNRTERVVGIDTIIPTLYRYYKESFAVKILDENGTLLQYFDTTAEGDVMRATATLESKRTSEQKALLSLYGASNRACNMFGAPWLGSTNKDAKERIDMYINGLSGYINNTFVDFSKTYSGLALGTTIEANKIYLNNFKNRKFKEIFSQYAYEGDTITESTYNAEGDITDDLITLTGSKQQSTKIVITYQLLSE